MAFSRRIHNSHDPLGAGMEQKPLYAITAEGTDVHTKGNALLVFDRGVEEVNWSSIYKLSGGRRLFEDHDELLAIGVFK